MKRFLLGVFAILMLLSCERETQFYEGKGTLCAYIASDDVLTKTTLVDNPGVRMVSTWTAGDQLGIFGSGASNQRFTLDAATLSDDGKRADFKSAESVPKGALTGYYPYQSGASKGSDGAITITFPAEQHSVSVAGALERPDPQANILAGTGTSDSGLSFRPVMALLKVGQRFDEDITIASVEFRDLSGAAVAGNLSISGGADPVGTITGTEKVITVYFDGDGIFIPAGALHPVFIVVPARSYDKGFEITFVDSEGGRTVKTVGTTGGKTLDRGVLHTIGDIAGKEYVPGAKTTLKPEAIIVTEEMAHQVRVMSLTTDVVRDINGEPIRQDGYQIHRPAVSLLVSDDINPSSLCWFIFNYGSEQVPDGGIFKVESLRPLGGGFSEVYATTEPNFGAPFEEVIMGEAMFDEAGNEVEDAGIDLDIASYISEIRDAEGKPMPFSVSPSGDICIGTEDMANALTKAVASASKDISLPGLSISYSGDHCSANFGATLNVGMKAAVKVTGGEVNFVHFTFHPTLDLKADFSISQSISFSRSVHLFTLYCAPGIPVAPGVILTPTMDVSASIGANANVTLNTTISYRYDMGRFGFSYQPEQGFMFRHFESEPDDASPSPELGTSLTARVSAGITLIAEPSIQFYGLFGAGLKLEYGISLVAQSDGNWSPTSSSHESYIALCHGITITPFTASLGGWFTKTWDTLKLEIELDDLWKRYLLPKFTEIRPGVAYDKVITLNSRYKGIKDGKYVWLERMTKNYPALPEFGLLHSAYTEVSGISTRITVPKDSPTLDDWEIYCDIETGSSGMQWYDLMMWGTMIGSYVLEDNTYEARVPLYENKIFTIAADGKDEIVDESVTGRPDDFPQGRIRSFSLRAHNTRSGKDVILYRSVPFTYYWPDTPLGPLYVAHTYEDYTDMNGKVHSAKEQYDAAEHSVWPADIPIP